MCDPDQGPLVQALSPRIDWTFDRFVPGNNIRAFNVFRLISRTRESQRFNPLIVAGPSGVGKSHLIHATIASLKRREPSLNFGLIEVKTASDEKKKRKEVSSWGIGPISLDSGNAEKITGDLSQMDYRAIIIDDVPYGELLKRWIAAVARLRSLGAAAPQFIFGVEVTSSQGKDLAAHCSELPCGKALLLSVPTEKTRRAIVFQKSNSAGLFLTTDAIAFICETVRQRNVRYLESALLQILAEAAQDRPSIESIEEILYRLANREHWGPVSTRSLPRFKDAVCQEVGRRFLVPSEELKARRNGAKSVDSHLARSVALYVFRQLTRLSLEAASKVFGESPLDAQLACSSVDARALTDESFGKKVSQLRMKSALHGYSLESE